MEFLGSYNNFKNILFERKVKFWNDVSNSMLCSNQIIMYSLFLIPK